MSITGTEGGKPFSKYFLAQRIKDEEEEAFDEKRDERTSSVRTKMDEEREEDEDRRHEERDVMFAMIRLRLIPFSERQVTCVSDASFTHCFHVDL